MAIVTISEHQFKLGQAHEAILSKLSVLHALGASVVDYFRLMAINNISVYIPEENWRIAEPICAALKLQDEITIKHWFSRNAFQKPLGYVYGVGHIRTTAYMSEALNQNNTYQYVCNGHIDCSNSSYFLQRLEYLYM